MFVVNLSLLMCKRRVRKVSMFKMCFLLREELLDILTLVIVLRQANVSLPPVIGHVKSLCFLTELHEIFAGCDCCDPGLRMTQEILFTSHMLTSLLQGLGPLRDAWKRYLRKHFVLPASYQNIADNLTRRALRKGFHSDIRSMSFKSFHEAWDPDEESWMMSQVIALHENFWMGQEDINRTGSIPPKEMTPREEHVSMIQDDIHGSEPLSNDEPDSFSSIAGDESPPHLQQKFDFRPTDEQHFQLYRNLYLAAPWVHTFVLPPFFGTSLMTLMFFA